MTMSCLTSNPLASATQSASFQSSRNWTQDGDTVGHYFGDTTRPSIDTGPFSPVPQGQSEQWTIFPFMLIHTLWVFIVRTLSPRVPTIEVSYHKAPQNLCPLSSTGSGGNDTSRMFNPRPAALERDTKQPSLLQSHLSSESPLSITIASTPTHQLPLPDGTWEVLSSWAIQNPIRCTIPRAFADTPKDKQDLIYAEIYKASVKKKYLALSEDLLVAEKLLNGLEQDEAALLLDVEQRQPGFLMLESSVALALARAARKSLNARKKVSEVQLAQAKLNVQRLMDAVEEISAAALEADHQLYSIVTAFRHSGWSITNLPTYSVDTAIFPLPPMLSTMKTLMPDNYPYLSGSAKSLSAHSSATGSNSFSL